MWCTCGNRQGYACVYEDGKQTDLWVCSRCRKPTRLVFKGHTDMLVPKGATALLSCTGRGDGITECRFATPEGKVTTLTYTPYPRKVDMDQGRGHLLNIWEKLDTELALIKQDVGGHYAEYHKARAGALAEVLAGLMAPFFTTREEITREALARWTAKQEGRDHVTPGLAEEVWDPQRNFDGSPRTPVGGGTAVVTTKALKLRPEQVAFVKKALDGGMMDAPALAGMFKVDVSEIEACR